jgi:hypothetical protein
VWTAGLCFYLLAKKVVFYPVWGVNFSTWESVQNWLTSGRIAVKGEKEKVSWIFHVLRAIEAAVKQRSFERRFDLKCVVFPPFEGAFQRRRLVEEGFRKRQKRPRWKTAQVCWDKRSKRKKRVKETDRTSARPQKKSSEKFVWDKCRVYSEFKEWFFVLTQKLDWATGLGIGFWLRGVQPWTTMR